MTEFEEIYRTYFGDVYLYIRGLSGDEGLAEEITSEAFFKAMGSLDRYRGDCDIRVWLCQIAKNCYYTHQKKAKRRSSMDDTELSQLPAEESTIEEKCIRRDEAEEIRAILHQIAEPYKEVFLWRVFGELSFRQIGQLFGKSENWACVTYHRAKTMVKSRLEEKTDDK